MFLLVGIIVRECVNTTALWFEMFLWISVVVSFIVSTNDLIAWKTCIQSEKLCVKWSVNYCLRDHSFKMFTVSELCKYTSFTVVGDQC